MTTPEHEHDNVDTGHALYRELKVVAATLVRAIKDEATPDAEQLLIKSLLDVRTRAQHEVFDQIHAAHDKPLQHRAPEPQEPNL